MAELLLRGFFMRRSAWFWIAAVLFAGCVDTPPPRVETFADGRESLDTIVGLDEENRSRAAVKPAVLSQNELSFTYSGWTAAEEQAIRDFLMTFGGVGIYQAMKDIYNQPSWAGTVQIKKAPRNPQFAGEYNKSLNTITLYCDTFNNTYQWVLTHELAHAFHDDFIPVINGRYVASYEEGMAEAAKILIKQRFGGTVTFQDPVQVNYEAMNHPIESARGGDFFIGDASLLFRRYMLAGYIWGKVAIEDPAFLRTFSAALYQVNPALLNFDDLQRIVTESKQGFDSGRIEGQAAVDWIKGQYLLDHNAKSGYERFVDLINYWYSENFIHYSGIISRNASGRESGLNNGQHNVRVKYYGTDGSLLYETSQDYPSNSHGWKYVYFDRSVFGGYRGRVRAVMFTTPTSAGGAAVRESYDFFTGSAGQGLFGIVAPETAGTIVVTDRNTGLTYEATLENGYFEIPALASVQGSLEVVYRDTNQQPKYSKIITKGSSAYRVILNGLPRVSQDLDRVPREVFSNNPATIRLEARDNQSISEAKLFWRYEGQSKFTEVGLNNLGPDEFGTTLTQTMKLGNIEFYIWVVDNEGNEMTSPVGVSDLGIYYKLNIFGTILNVDANHTGFENGSLTHPYRSLHTALAFVRRFVSDGRTFTIYVAPATYRFRTISWTDNILPPNTQLISLEGPEATIIDIDRPTGQGVGLNSNTLVQGFTLKNGGYLVHTWDLRPPDALAEVRNNILIGTGGISSAGLRNSYGGTVVAENNSIVNAWAGVQFEGGSPTTLRNNIVVRNTFRDIAMLTAAPYQIDYNDYRTTNFQVNGVGNLSVDPLFLSDTDFHLQAGSPAIDAGDPNGLKDLDGTRADMGAYGGRYKVSWPDFVVTPESGEPTVPRTMKSLWKNNDYAYLWEFGDGVALYVTRTDVLRVLYFSPQTGVLRFYSDKIAAATLDPSLYGVPAVEYTDEHGNIDYHYLLDPKYELEYERAPTHQYEYAGTYQCRLSVRNGGQLFQKSELVTVASGSEF